MEGKFNKVLVYYNLLKLEGPKRGYFPELTRLILVVKPQSVEHATANFYHLDIKIATGTRHLGEHIEKDDCCIKWVKEKVEGWVEGVRALAKVAKNSLQCAFAGLQKSLKSEWMYLQGTTSVIWQLFAPVEDAISTSFFPALIGTDTTSCTPPSLRTP